MDADAGSVSIRLRIAESGASVNSAREKTLQGGARNGIVACRQEIETS